jgi:hypothetical protein
MNLKAAICCAACTLVLLGGCNSASKPTPQNFMKTLNDYYQDRNACLFPQGRQFPYEVAPGTGAKQDKQKMDALLHSNLVKRLEDLDLHVDSYSLNAAGERYGPRFCYGHRTIASIESFTPPAPHNGFTETTVTYHYTMEDVPVWAKTDEMKAAFPQLAKDLGDDPIDQQILATAGTDWQVPQ